ncbi:MAG: recombination protein O N-terminal domain-containing protein [Muribaculaceae bacterium]|nr:recombination protein O N-terminal domain-containing protein [Muribaculaceae bacterium]
MNDKMECVVLRVIPHNERSVIVTCYSDVAGRLSFVSPGGNGREARRRRALLMPLSVVECVALSSSKELVRVRDVSRPSGFEDFSLNPMKIVVALFVADLLESLTRNSDADPFFFRFIRSAVMHLGKAGATATANFHLALMAGVIRQAGIEPDLSSYREGYLFDMREGIFRGTPPMHDDFLERDESEWVRRLCRMDMLNSRFFRLNRAGRNRAMDLMLEYISLHLKDVRHLRSVDVVRSL